MKLIWKRKQNSIGTKGRRRKKIPESQLFLSQEIFFYQVSIVVIASESDYLIQPKTKASTLSYYEL